MNNFKRTALLTALLLAPCLLNGEEPQFVQKVFQIRYANVEALVNVLNIFGHRVSAEPRLHAIAVSAPESVVTAMEEAIKRFDVPAATPKNVELTVYLLVASEQAGASNTSTELAAVITQLKGLFAYKSFNLMDTLVVRGRGGQGTEASGVVSPGSANDPKSISLLTIRSTSITQDEKGRLIRIDGLRLDLNVPILTSASAQYQSLRTGIATDIDVREGQKVVVGKTNLNGADRALVLVVTAKVID